MWSYFTGYLGSGQILTKAQMLELAGAIEERHQVLGTGRSLYSGSYELIKNGLAPNGLRINYPEGYIDGAAWLNTFGDMLGTVRVNYLIPRYVETEEIFDSSFIPSSNDGFPNTVNETQVFSPVVQYTPSAQGVFGYSAAFSGANLLGITGLLADLSNSKFITTGKFNVVKEGLSLLRWMIMRPTGFPDRFDKSMSTGINWTHAISNFINKPEIELSGPIPNIQATRRGGGATGIFGARSIHSLYLQDLGQFTSGYSIKEPGRATQTFVSPGTYTNVITPVIIDIGGNSVEKTFVLNSGSKWQWNFMFSGINTVGGFAISHKPKAYDDVGTLNTYDVTNGPDTKLMIIHLMGQSSFQYVPFAIAPSFQYP